MTAVDDRTTTIEALQRITSRLLDSNLTIAEANALRPQLYRLLGETGADSGDGRGAPAPFPRTGP